MQLFLPKLILDFGHCIGKIIQQWSKQKKKQCEEESKISNLNIHEDKRGGILLFTVLMFQCCIVYKV